MKTSVCDIHLSCCIHVLWEKPNTKQPVGAAASCTETRPAFKTEPLSVGVPLRANRADRTGTGRDRRDAGSSACRHTGGITERERSSSIIHQHNSDSEFTKTKNNLLSRRNTRYCRELRGLMKEERLHECV